jgi:hypothetical protein
VKPPLAALEPNETERLLADIYYLNTAELRGFCDAHRIPYTIRIEGPDARFTRSKDADRKGIVIDRVVHFLKTGDVKPATTFRRQVVGGSKELARAPFESDQVRYGEYKNHDAATLKLMKQLTDSKFEFGAMAQEVLRACWSRNQAPTYREFARLWEKAVADHSKPNPEWAFLTDLARGTAGRDWKKLRSQKASAVLSLLGKITAEQSFQNENRKSTAVATKVPLRRG